MTKENRQYATYTNTVNALIAHDIQLEQIADIALDAQLKYNPHLTLIDATNALKSVLQKRDIQQLVLTGLALDTAASNRSLESEVLNDQIQFDDGLFGVDEAIAFAIVQQYGPIAMTNYGNIDKNKPGLIGKLDEAGKEADEIVTTFADDIVGALAACASAKMASNLH